MASHDESTALDSDRTAAPRVLVVQHEDDCPPALVGAWLADDGVTLDVRRPYTGEPDQQLPADLAGHDGLLVLGGPMDADSDADHAWLATTKGLVREAARDDVPVLGICLGHQVVASALGGTVGRNPLGRQLGLLPVGWTASAAADPLVGALAGTGGQRCTHWNQDVVLDLPEGTEVLAVAPAGEVQAARFAARVWGVQNHPEADETIVKRWAATSDPADVSAERGAAVVDAVAGARAELDEAWRPLAAGFAQQVGRPASA